MQQLEERFADDQGGRVRYLVGGSGDPMLLCHGFIGSAENFEAWFPALLPRRTVVVPDLPGFGSSTPLAGRHSPAALAQAALVAADHAGISRFDVGGLCLGTSVAMAVMRLRPDAVQRIILHTPMLAPGLVRLRFHLQVGLMTAPMVWPGIVWLGHQRVISDMYKRFLVEGPVADQAAAQVNFDNQMRAEPRAAREWLGAGLACDDLALLRQSAQPTMIMMARDDRIIDVARIVRALGSHPNLELVVIDDAGHAWTEALTARQRAYIAAFLDGRPLASAADAAA